jgi:hypothetical protein
MGGEHCGIYTGSYNVSNVLYMNSPPQTFSFLPHCPTLIFGVVSAGVILAFTYMYTHFFLAHIHPSTLFPHWCQPTHPGQDLFYPPVL